MRFSSFLLVTLAAYFAFLLSIALDLSISRVVIGFIFFSIVPGYALVKLLKMDELDLVEVVLFSVGFSIAFLMLFGFLLNEFAMLAGVSSPLSFTPMVISFSTIVVAGIAIVEWRRCPSLNFPRMDLSVRSPAIFAFLFLPVLSAIGTYFLNATGSNVILFFMFALIAVLVGVVILFENVLDQRFYPIAIVSIAIALLFSSSLVSNYIVPMGSDSNVEYFVSKVAESNRFWNSTSYFFGDLGFQRINAMLSIGILPNVYSILLGIDLTWVFKILFPIIFSLVPLVLYEFWRFHVQPKYAFLSAFLFMSLDTFYTEMLGLNRQIIAELFFALLFIVILSKQMNRSSKMLSFVIFSIGLVTSHYGLAEIFFFFIPGPSS